MNHIKNYLPNFTQTLQPEQHWRLLILHKWQEIMGSLADKVSIYKIYNNSITLGVTDSSWMHELNLFSALIKDKINTQLDKPRIELIRFKYVTEHKNHVQKKENSLSLPYQEKTLTKGEQLALESIKDPELSQALLGFLQKCHRFS